jgi:hypothetical protein
MVKVREWDLPSGTLSVPDIPFYHGDNICNDLTLFRRMRICPLKGFELIIWKQGGRK